MQQRFCIRKVDMVFKRNFERIWSDVIWSILSVQLYKATDEIESFKVT